MWKPNQQPGRSLPSTRLPACRARAENRRRAAASPTCSASPRSPAADSGGTNSAVGSRSPADVGSAKSRRWPPSPARSAPPLPAAGLVAAPAPPLPAPVSSIRRFAVTCARHGQRVLGRQLRQLRARRAAAVCRLSSIGRLPLRHDTSRVPVQVRFKHLFRAIFEWQMRLRAQKCTATAPAARCCADRATTTATMDRAEARIDGTSSAQATPIAMRFPGIHMSDCCAVPAARAARGVGASTTCPTAGAFSIEKYAKENSHLWRGHANSLS